MKFNTDIFKIETNHVIPSRGKVLISEPFLRDNVFGRSVVLLVEHTSEGTMGLVINKPLPFTLNQVMMDFSDLEEEIPLYKGGPLAPDTLFYLHTLPDIPHSIQIKKNLYLNGDFSALKEHIIQGYPVKHKIRFFLGYSGWEENQLVQEISDNTWMVGEADASELIDGSTKTMWGRLLSKLGSKYQTWARFPQIPSLN